MQQAYQKTLQRLTALYLNSEQFNGVRGDRLALEAEMDETMARIVFRDLCTDGLIDIASPKVFANPYIKADRSIPKDIQFADIDGELTKFCVYPSSKYLTEAVKKKRYPVYKMELARGGGQLDIGYFHDAVLDHYRADPAKYIVNEEPFGMGPGYENVKGLSRRQWHKAWGRIKCTGVRQLSNGKRAICVLLRYLTQLPADEQEHWQSFELTQHEQDFLPDSADEPFTKWYCGSVRSKPQWQTETNEDEDDEDEDEN